MSNKELLIRKAIELLLIEFDKVGIKPKENFDIEEIVKEQMEIEW